MIKSLKRIKDTNATEVQMLNGVTVLYSYGTLVACRDDETGKYYRTDQHYSVTTSKHLNRWCVPNAEKVSQARLEEIVKYGGIMRELSNL